MFPYYQQDYSSSRASNSAGWYGHANDASCPPYELQSTPYWREQHYTPNSYQQYQASHSYQAQYYDRIPLGYEHVPQDQNYILEQQEPEVSKNDIMEFLKNWEKENDERKNWEKQQEPDHEPKMHYQTFNSGYSAQSAMQQTNDQHLVHLREEITGSQDQCEHDYGSLSNEVHHVPTTSPSHVIETQIVQQSEHALPEDFEMTDEDWECPYDEWITKGYACLASLSNPVQAPQSEHASPEDSEMTEEDWESIDDEWVPKGFESFPPYYVEEISNNLSEEQDSLPTISELEEPQGEQLKDEVPKQSHAHVHKDFVDVYLDTLKETPPAQQVEILKEVVKIDTPIDLHEESKLDVSINFMERGAPPEDQLEELKIGVPIRIDAPYEDVFLPLPLKPPDNFWNYMVTHIWSVRGDAFYFQIPKGRNLHKSFRSKLQHPIIFGGPLFQWDFKVD